MKLFWRIVALAYSQIRLCGFNLPLYSFLFNKPKVKFHETIIETLHADTAFDLRERNLILEAAEDIYRFTNHRIKFDIIFDLEQGDDIYSSCVIIKANSTNQYIQDADKEFKNNVIGLCYYRENETKSVHLVGDRLATSKNLFRTTAVHEFGHYIGMDHTARGSIMQPINSNLVLYPTYIDAVELAKVWKCLPTDFEYFKL